MGDLHRVLVLSKCCPCGTAAYSYCYISWVKLLSGSLFMVRSLPFPLKMEFLRRRRIVPCAVRGSLHLPWGLRYPPRVEAFVERRHVGGGPGVSPAEFTSISLKVSDFVWSPAQPSNPIQRVKKTNNPLTNKNPSVNKARRGRKLTLAIMDPSERGPLSPYPAFFVKTCFINTYNSSTVDGLVKPTCLLNMCW